MKTLIATAICIAMCICLLSQFNHEYRQKSHDEFDGIKKASLFSGNECTESFTLYPGFQELIADTSTRMNEKFRIGMQNRQFMADLHILKELEKHPCRARYNASSPTSFFGEKHAFIIPVPWCSLINIHSKELIEHASELTQNIFNGKLFRTFPHKHVVLWTCTAPKKIISKAIIGDFMDARIIRVGFEGFLGDSRWPSLAREVVVPYYVEKNEDLDRLLKSSKNNNVTARTIEVFFRCSLSKVPKKDQGNTSLRHKVISLFSNQKLLQVDVVGHKERLERNSIIVQQREFIDYFQAMRKSTFCLVTPGITSSSKRLYEALQCGCIPVILSKNIALPFYQDINIRRLWRSSVIYFDPEKNALNTLPIMLANISSEEARTRREYIKKLANIMVMSDGNLTCDYLLKEIMHMLGFGSRHTNLQRSLRNVLDSADMTYVVSYFSLSVVSPGIKRPTTPLRLKFWAESLRRHYFGKVIILMGGQDSETRKLCHSLNISLIDNVGRTIAPISATMPSFHSSENDTSLYPITLQGNQMRLLWFAEVMHCLSVLSPSARVLVMDIRDIFVQKNPFLAVDAFVPRSICKFVGVDDCHDCIAGTDSYFQTWGERCLSNSLFNSQNLPPVNGGIQFGETKQLSEVYATAAILATIPANDFQDYCIKGGRDQHLITATVRHYQNGGGDFCVLKNNPANQSAALNMGVNNRLKGKYLLDLQRRVVTTGNGDPIAIVHQYDRHTDVLNFFEIS